MSKLNKGYHCWITNATNRKIVLGDLRFTLKPFQTIDILDDRHSNYTLEEIENSINKGSIGARLNKSIYVRKEAPIKKNNKKIEISKVSYPFKKRTIVEFDEPNYEELQINTSDEEFANDNADVAGNEKDNFLGKTNDED